jgi:uncharacterized protein YjbJ (UPF0337 family)
MVDDFGSNPYLAAALKVLAMEVRSNTTHTRGANMKLSTTDQVEGKLHELRGKAKQKAGQVIKNPNLEAEGQDEKIAGKVQKKVGQIEKVFEK